MKIEIPTDSEMWNWNLIFFSVLDDMNHMFNSLGQIIFWINSNCSIQVDIKNLKIKVIFSSCCFVIRKALWGLVIPRTSVVQKFFFFFYLVQRPGYVFMKFLNSNWFINQYQSSIAGNGRWFISVPFYKTEPCTAKIS